MKLILRELKILYIIIFWSIRWKTAEIWGGNAENEVRRAKDGVKKASRAGNGGGSAGWSAVG